MRSSFALSSRGEKSTSDSCVVKDDDEMDDSSSAAAMRASAPPASLNYLPSNLFGSNNQGGGGGGVEQAPARRQQPTTGDHSERSDYSSVAAESTLESLEGTLSFKRGRRTLGRGGWRESYVVLNIKDGGSIKCYKPKDALKSAPTWDKGSSLSSSRGGGGNNATLNVESKFVCSRNPDFASLKPQLEIPAKVDWVAKDMESDSSQFVIEIVSDQPIKSNTMIQDNSIIAESSGDEASVDDKALRGASNRRPHRFYFKCARGSHEKTLWLEAFRRLNRLSDEMRKKKNLIADLKANLQAHSRVRSERAERLVAEGQAMAEMFGEAQGSLTLLDHHTTAPSSLMMMTLSDHNLLRSSTTTRESLSSSSNNNNASSSPQKEYVVYPMYAYPHRWMTNLELHREMLKPSEHFHDLRMPPSTKKKLNEIGHVKLEILQCKGLPALDRMSETDAVVYAVCGSYAFCTDVIWNRLNPIWLPKSRRACIFPLFHAYAQLFVGVFDDDGKNEKDDFAGRIAIDLARCRPRSTYDVMLPLRTSTHVYSKRRRGAIRIRFTIHWNSDREALLSYIPKKLNPPSSVRPDDDTTLLCADEKSFRNIAFTVHGVDMPGHFSFRKWKATTRELNFARKVCVKNLRENMAGFFLYENPTVSFILFCAYMHCIYANSFALVPAYAALMVLLTMVYNYAHFGIDTKMQNGMTPPSWEEMFYALLRKDVAHAITPLEMDTTTMIAAAAAAQPTTTNLRQSLSNNNTAAAAAAASSLREQQQDVVRRSFVTVGTGTGGGPYKPMGKSLFKILGFEEDPNAAPSDYQMEMPFSVGQGYPRFTIKECLVSKSSILALSKKKKPLSGGGGGGGGSGSGAGSDEADDVMNLVDDDDDDVFSDGGGSEGKSSDKTLPTTTTTTTTTPGAGATTTTNLDYDPEEENFYTSNLMAAEAREKLHMDQALERVDQVMETAKAAGSMGRKGGDDDEQEHDPSLVEEEEVVKPPAIIPQWKVIPEQNMDVKTTRKKKLADELSELQRNLHKITCHVFNDRTHVIRQENPCYFGQARSGRKEVVGQQLDSLLNVGRYSSASPPVARVGLILEPVISGLHSLICATRAVYNIFTWRDPFLSFWFSLALLGLVIFLFIFPWRLFFGVVGFIVLGPQNLLFRILVKTGKIPKFVKKLLHKKKPKPKVKKEIDDIPLDQPIMASHTSDGKPPVNPTHDQVDKRGIHQVCIPNSQLMYQRFYDWPPEAQYAQVQPEASLLAARRSGSTIGGGASSDSMELSSSPVVARSPENLRKRFQTSKQQQQQSKVGSTLRFK